MGNIMTMARGKGGKLASRLRESSRDQTAQVILEAAEEIFAREGLHAAKVGDIAKRAGIAVGTLYNYFEDRDAIVRALLEARGNEIREQLEASQLQHRGDFSAELQGIVEAMLSSFRKHCGFVAVMAQSDMFARVAGGSTKFNTQRLAREILERLQEVMRRGVTEGALRPGSIPLYAMALASLVRAVALAPIAGTVELPEVTGEQIVELFLRGTAAGR